MNHREWCARVSTQASSSDDLNASTYSSTCQDVQFQRKPAQAMTAIMMMQDDMARPSFNASQLKR